MTRDAASLMRRFLRTIGVVTFLAICLNVETSSFAADFDVDRHAEYCGCGTKCRREKCCCGPSENVAGEFGADPSAIPPPSNPVMTFRNFLCRMMAPCGTDADAPGSRVFRSFVPVAAASAGSAPFDEDSYPFVPIFSGFFIPDVYASGVDRPPEIQA